MSLAPLSLRAYAAHRKGLSLPGGTLQAVQRAIAGRRLVDCLVVVGGVKRIADPEAADREWAANTDLSKAPGWVKELGDDESEDDESAPSSLATASAREKLARAQLAELRLQRERSEVVNAEDVKAEWSERCSTVRTRMLGVASNVKQRHPELSILILATIDEEIRKGLEELSQKSDNAPE